MATTAVQTSSASVPRRGVDWLQLVLGILALLMTSAIMWAALIYARPATNLAGDEQLAQRIFYIHMDVTSAPLPAFSSLSSAASSTWSSATWIGTV